jgi:hypothetical protein
MHLRRLRKADRLVDQAFATHTQHQILALDLLTMPFPRAVNVMVRMLCVRAAMIRREAGKATGLQQCFALPKDHIFTTTKDIRQEGSRMMAKRMP